MAAVLAAWQLVSAANVVSETSLPAPGTTFAAIDDLFNDDAFTGGLAATLRAWLAGTAIAIAVAVPVGLIAGHFEFWNRSTKAPIDVFRSVPPAALIPIAISVMGLGFRTKVALVAFSVVWLVLINTIYGVRGVDPVALLTARSMRWNRRETFMRLVLPSASPSIATGVRLAAAIAFVVVLSCELLGVGGGVGAQMLRYGGADRTDAIYGSILVIGAVGVAITSGLSALERRLLRWHGDNAKR